MEQSKIPSLNLQPLRRTRCASDTACPTTLDRLPNTLQARMNTCAAEDFAVVPPTATTSLRPLVGTEVVLLPINKSPLISPRNTNHEAPQISPRLTTHIDSPRPSPEIVQRRMSQGHAKKPLSQLRKSQTELTMTQHLKTKDQQIEALKPLATTSGKTRADLIIKPVGIIADSDKKNAIDSPPLGRLESYIAPMHLLEQVILSPGGGIELRQVLGVYTSKRAALQAAKTFAQEHPDEIHNTENLVQLVTSEVPIDKPPTGNHSHEPVSL